LHFVFSPLLISRNSTIKLLLGLFFHAIRVNYASKQGL
jgi:hypothetical protein